MFVPGFNAYADGSRITNHLVWIVLRVANRSYTIPVLSEPFRVVSTVAYKLWR
jgi:hypothetical protein